MDYRSGDQVLKPVADETAVTLINQLFPRIAPLNSEERTKLLSASLHLSTPDSDGLVVLPSMHWVVNRIGSQQPAPFNDALDAVLTAVHPKIPQLNVQLRAITRQHIFRSRRGGPHSNRLDLDGWGKFAGYMRLHVQLGRKFPGLSAHAAQKHFREATEWSESGLDPMQALLILTLHYMAHGYMPNVAMLCPGAAVCPEGDGSRYTHCPVVEAHNNVITLRAVHEQTEDPQLGAATFYYRHEAYLGRRKRRY